MANAIIQKYLNQSVHNYDEGRILFEKFSDDEVLKVLFRSGSSSYHHVKLLDALSSLSLIEVAPATVKPVAPRVLIPELASFDSPKAPYKEDEYNSFPNQIQEIIRKKNQHYKRAMQLFVEIGFTEDQDMRLEMALVLLNDYEQIQSCWSIIDDYKESGKVLVEKSKTIQEEVDEMNAIQAVKSINNVRANISKDKKKLESLPDGHKKAKVLLRYQSNLVKLDLLQKKIGGNDE